MFTRGMIDFKNRQVVTRFVEMKMKRCNLRFSLVIQKFEPKFEINDESQTLWKFYKKNFKSWLQPKGVCDPVELRLLIVDYQSSADFRQLLQQFADQNAEIDLLLGDHTLSSTKALNVGLQETVDADLCAYVASDSAAVDSNWLKLVDAEFRANPSASVIFTTCSVGIAKFLIKCRCRQLISQQKFCPY